MHAGVRVCMSLCDSGERDGGGEEGEREKKSDWGVKRERERVCVCACVRV